MQNEVQLIVKAGSIVSNTYTVNFGFCPQAGEIVCGPNKIDLTAVTPALSNTVWQTLADTNGTIELFEIGRAHV